MQLIEEFILIAFLKLKVRDHCFRLIYRFFAELDSNYEYILAVAIAATSQSCAMKTKAIALAPAMAFSLAATLRKLLATLSNWRKRCPKDLPHVILLLLI